jgi:hypothetical protein
MLQRQYRMRSLNHDILLARFDKLGPSASSG